MPINRVLKAIEEIKKGNMVIMVDDEDRENEGDLVYAGIFSTPEKVNFMASKAKGLICVSISKESANRLNLTPMVAKNDAQYETAFTISVDHKNSTTGISAYERDETIRELANPVSHSSDFVKPGHIFPLIAKDGGVLVRTGHTEGSLDLCRLAGLSDSAVICEVMKENGEMARRDDLDKFAKEHNLVTVYISDIVEYRLKNESLIKEISKEDTLLLNEKVQKVEFIDHLEHKHFAFIFNKENINKTSFVKFHNIAKDIELFLKPKKFNSLLSSIEFLKEKSGVLILLDNKLEDSDSIKDFGIGAQILKKLGIENIKLITAHSHKEFVGISGFGLNVVEDVEVEG